MIERIYEGGLKAVNELGDLGATTRGSGGFDSTGLRSLGPGSSGDAESRSRDEGLRRRAVREESQRKDRRPTEPMVEVTYHGDGSTSVAHVTVETVMVPTQDASRPEPRGVWSQAAGNPRSSSAGDGGKGAGREGRRLHGRNESESKSPPPGRGRAWRTKYGNAFHKM